jgi:tRNA uridine 5-carbamoylmethylation protein Kti12
MSYYIIIRGPLASGKSTIAKKLSEILKAEYIAVDVVLDENNLTKDKEEGYVSQKSFLKVNEITIPKAKKLLDQKIPVIFDGNFYWESQIKDLLEKLDYPHYIFTLKASLSTCIDRDIQRGETHGKIAAEVVHKKSTSFESGIPIETDNKTADEIVNDILYHLKK